MWNFSTPFFFLFYKFPHKIFVFYLFNVFISSCLCILWKCWHNDCCFIVEEWNIECITKKVRIMKKLMLSVAVFMMGVSTLGLYAQDSNVEPVKKDSVPTEEPKKEEPKSEAAWVCMSEEPAKTDSVPSQEPKKEEPKTSSVYMNEEPAKTDSVPSQEPKKEDVQKIFSIR